MANGTIAFDTLSTSGQIGSTLNKSVKTAHSCDTDYIVSGAVKMYAHITQGTPVVNNSLNSSSHTDSGTGISDIAFINNMFDQFFTSTIGGRNTGNYVHFTVLAADSSTSQARAQSLINANTGEDSADLSIQVVSDLAQET